MRENGYRCTVLGKCTQLLRDSNAREITCLFYFRKGVKGVLPIRYKTKHQTICLDREVLHSAIVGLCQVHEMRELRHPVNNTYVNK